MKIYLTVWEYHILAQLIENREAGFTVKQFRHDKVYSLFLTRIIKNGNFTL